jgi:hypothetical protein
MACTPLISRHAIPAIFCTTPCATVILPSSVNMDSVAAGLVSLILLAGLADGVELVWVIRKHSLSTRGERPCTGYAGPAQSPGPVLHC